MNAAAASGTNGVQAKLESLGERINKVELNVDNLILHGCPTGRTEAKGFERGLEELRNDINELYTRMRGVEAKQNYWGGGLGLLIVLMGVITKLL